MHVGSKCWRQVSPSNTLYLAVWDRVSHWDLQFLIMRSSLPKKSQKSTWLCLPSMREGGYKNMLMSGFFFLINVESGDQVRSSCLHNKQFRHCLPSPFRELQVSHWQTTLDTLSNCLLVISTVYWGCLRANQTPQNQIWTVHHPHQTHSIHSSPCLSWW